MMFFCFFKKTFFIEVNATDALQCQQICAVTPGSLIPLQSPRFHHALQQKNKKLLWTKNPSSGHSARTHRIAKPSAFNLHGRFHRFFWFLSCQQGMSTIITGCNIPGGLLVRLQDASTYSQLWHQASSEMKSVISYHLNKRTHEPIVFFSPVFFECWMQMILSLLSYFVIFYLNLPPTWQFRGGACRMPGQER